MKDVLTLFSITDDGALINENSRQEKAAYVTSLKLYTGDYISKLGKNICIKQKVRASTVKLK